MHRHERHQLAELHNAVEQFSVSVLLAEQVFDHAIHRLGCVALLVEAVLPVAVGLAGGCAIQAGVAGAARGMGADDGPISAGLALVCGVGADLGFGMGWAFSPVDVAKRGVRAANGPISAGLAGLQDM